MRAKKRAVPESSSKREGPDFQSGRKCHLTDSGFTVLKNSLLGGAALKAPRISPFFSFLAGLYPLQSVTKPPPAPVHRLGGVEHTCNSMMILLSA
jgi:hypothetical protein